MVGGVVLSASKAMKTPIPRFETAELIVLAPSVPRGDRGESECRASDFAAAAGPADPRPRLRRPEWCRSVPGRELVPGSIRSSAEIVPRSKAQGRALADRQIGTACVSVRQQK